MSAPGSARLSRTIGLTLLSELASVAATAWVTRRFARVYVEGEVDAYFVVRQVLGWVMNVGLLGLNVSLPRALARDPGPRSRRRHVAAALLLSAPLLAGIVLIALLAPSPAARLLLHDGSMAPLLMSACFLFCANALFAVTSAAMQGLDRFGSLALVRIVAWGVAPPATVALLGGRASLPLVLSVWALVLVAIDGTMLLLVGRALFGASGAAEERAPSLRGLCRELLGFGGVRMVGAIAQVSQVALAPTLVLWSGADGRAAAAFSVAAMFTMLLAPLRLALQPVALTQLAQIADPERAKPLARDYFSTVACLAAAATAALGMAGDRLVDLWLEGRYAAVAVPLRASVLVIGLHFFCYAVEGALDAHDTRHGRPRVQLISAAVFYVGVGIAAALGAGWPGILVAQLAGALVQTVLYVRMMAWRYGLPARRELVHGALTLGAGVALAGLALRLLHGAGGTVVLLGGEAAVALLLVALARGAGARWPALLLGSLGRRRAATAAPSPAPLAASE